MSGQIIRKRRTISGGNPNSSLDQALRDQAVGDQLAVPRRPAAGERVRQALDEQLRLEGAALPQDEIVGAARDLYEKVTAAP